MISPISAAGAVTTLALARPEKLNALVPELLDELRSMYGKPNSSPRALLEALNTVDVLDGDPEVVLCYPMTRLVDTEGKPLSDYEDMLNLALWLEAERMRGLGLTDSSAMAFW